MKLKNYYHFLFLFYSLTVSNLLGNNLSNIISPNKSKVTQLIRQINTLGFQENKGQMADTDGNPTSYVLFKTEAPCINIWVTTTGLTYQFLKFEKEKLSLPNVSKDKREFLNHDKSENIIVNWHRVDMILKDAKILKENIITEGDITKGKIDYYFGHCPEGALNIKTFSKIIIKDIYDGIDWILYTNINGNSLKQDFVVHANANPNQIKLIYEGSGKFDLINNQIRFKNEFGELQEGKLYCYQGKESNEISSYYNIMKNNHLLNIGAGNFSRTHSLTSSKQKQATDFFSYEINIVVANYNKSKPLTIDPQLVWATFFGGNAQEAPFSIDCDLNDNLLMTGFTYSNNFPILNAGNNSYFQSNMSGTSDLFIYKFNNSGALLWGTYYGGSKDEFSRSIKADSQGNIFIVGQTESNNFPLFNPGGNTFYQSQYSNTDAYIMKFTGSGTRLWATYYGGSNDDYGFSISIDFNDNIFVMGETASNNIPLLNLGSGSYFQPTNNGYSTTVSIADGFITKFNNSGDLIWATYYGGNKDDRLKTSYCDLSGNLYIVGSTNSTNFPLLNSGATSYFQSVYGGGIFDGIIMKFTNNGIRLWATYFGGNGWDTGEEIITDSKGNLFVSIETMSTNLPTQNPGGGAYYQPAYGGSTADLFMIKFDNTYTVMWATYFGGAGIERNWYSSRDVIIDKCDNIYFSMVSGGSTLPLVTSCNSGFNSAVIGIYDLYIVKFNNFGKIIWSSYFGSDGVGEQRQALAIDSKGNFFIAGETSGIINLSSFPFTNPGNNAFFTNTPSGGIDGLIAKFSPSILSSNVSTSPSFCNCDGTAIVSTSGGCTPYKYEWYDNSWNAIGTNIDTIKNLCSGNYQVIVSDTINCVPQDTTSFIISAGSTTVVASVSSNTTITLGSSTTLVANGGNTYVWLSPNSNLNTTTGNVVVATPTETTTYCVEVTDSNGCKDTACVKVTVEIPCNINNDLIIPNAFSPNNDHVNDEFCLQGWENCIEEFEIIIFDRWGEKVFESGDVNFCWNGIYNGLTMDSQVFVYSISAKNKTSEIKKSGNISLIR